MGLVAIVLGAAAGGGYPQWNCRCAVCEPAWRGSPGALARTQASIAFSADRRHWLVVGASPDLREQIIATPALHPRDKRDSPIFAIALVSADVDGVAGLLTVRERQDLRVIATAPVLEILRANPVFGVLDPAVVRRAELVVDTPLDLGHGLRLTLLPMPGKVPLYLEDRGAAQAEAAPTFAALVEAGGRRAIFAPGCAEITAEVRDRLGRADVLFFDGTVFDDDEMIAAGVGHKTGRRMGHAPVAGPQGSLARLSGLRCRRIYVHINNTNPILLADSPERRIVEEAGWTVAHDGLEVDV